MGCGECVVCRRGDENLCTKPCSVGVHRSGGYATHLLVPHPRYLFDIGGIAPERAAPLACSGVTAYGALKKVSETLKDEPVVMIGAGGVGLMGLALHKAMGGKSAIVVDIDPAKREAAKRAGASATIDGNAPDVLDQIRAATGGGVWASIDFVGAGATVKLGVDAAIKGGKVVVVGLFGGDVVVPTPFFPIKAHDDPRVICRQSHRNGGAAGSGKGKGRSRCSGGDPAAGSGQCRTQRPARRHASLAAW